MGGMEEMEQKEKRGTLFILGRKGNQESQERKGTRVFMECRDLLGFLVPVDQLVRKACVETPACKDLKENRKSRVHHQEEPPNISDTSWQNTTIMLVLQCMNVLIKILNQFQD